MPPRCRRGFASRRAGGRWSSPETLDHSLTGILASLAVPLAAAGVPIFALSTFDTDYVLVPADRLGDAADALRAAGHQIAGAAG